MCPQFSHTPAFPGKGMAALAFDFSVAEAFVLSFRRISEEYQNRIEKNKTRHISKQGHSGSISSG
jgi:hypothetical protein